MELTKEELNSISGGMAIRTRMLLIGGFITFISGIIDGFLRPLKCNF